MIVLQGRRDECAVLDGLLDGVRAGRSGALVVHGEAGVGKTALLEYAIEARSELTVLRAMGVESEIELAYAALHQLCAPLLDRLDGLPGQQRDALQTAFGLGAAAAPDRFFVGLATLSLLSEVAEERPLLCVVDDAQWLDVASAQALGFVARRLLIEPIVLLFAAREPSALFADLPQLVVEGLRDPDARALLASVIPGRLDDRVADQLLAEAQGNPLALSELPMGLSPAQLAGGFGLPGALSLSGRIERSYLHRLAVLPENTRRLLLLAAAEPTGDQALLWRAAERLGIAGPVLEPAESAGLLEIGARVRFRHPLARSAVYRAATPPQRRQVHRALADATDARSDPDRRAWHLAEAASSPDEDVASQLVRSAGRAQARGGLAAVAAFLERAAALTPESSQRAERLLAAAAAKRDAGDLEAALRLLRAVEAGPHDELTGACVDLLQGEIALDQMRGRDAGRSLMSAARRLEPLAPELARETYLEVLVGATASDLEIPGGAQAVAATARAAPPGPPPPRVVDVLLDSFAIRLTDGYRAAAPTFARALQMLLATDVRDEEVGRRLSLSSSLTGNTVSLEMWDADAVHLLAVRQVQLARDTGALVHLEFALSFLARSHLLAGALTDASLVVDEARLIADATGTPPLVNAPLVLAAFRGREPQASDLIGASSEEAAGRRWTSNAYAKAVLYNGLGRHDTARDAVRDAFQRDPIGYGTLLVPELAEAASRTGDRPLLESALQWLSERTGVISSEWAFGMEARVRALLREGEAAETLYRESIAHLGKTRVRLELARSHLLYGQWLRRERRRVEAREQLRTALEMFTHMGTEAFAGRAERELTATGERVRKRSIETRDELTAQEAQIAWLAREGLSNQEIGARLFISQHTVAYHLRKVFTKLDITSRAQLKWVLEREPSPALQ